MTTPAASAPLTDASLPDRAIPRRSFFWGRSFDTECTLRIAHTAHELSAHVELDVELEVGPGDRVRVHGGAIAPAFGSVDVERRLATVTRASHLEKLWVRLTGDLGCLELLDVSFTDRRIL